MMHDKCYGDVEKLPCKVIFQKPYTVHYAWRWVEDRKQAYCRTYNSYLFNFKYINPTIAFTPSHKKKEIRYGR